MYVNKSNNTFFAVLINVNRSKLPFFMGMKKVGSVLRADFYVYKDLP